MLGFFTDLWTGDHHEAGVRGSGPKGHRSDAASPQDVPCPGLGVPDRIARDVDWPGRGNGQHRCRAPPARA
eukprot:2645709-Alexandrium_andersonii.AAC.1